MEGIGNSPNRGLPPWALLYSKERTKGLVTREMMMEDCLVFIDNLSVASEIRIVATALITSSYF